VATPIGHARDITLRALDILAGCRVIACEDTRVARKLFAIHRLGEGRPPPRFVACHDHNEAAVADQLIARISEGVAVALVSDAGTPLVSDPGYRLVAQAIARGVPVVPVPGPSAVLAALSVAGLATDRFLFAGFLPPRSAARQRAIAALEPVAATLVLLESPRRLAAALADLAAGLGPRPAAVARELTKKFETVRRGTLDALAAAYAAEPPPRGEVTVVIGPPDAAAAPAPDAEAVDTLLRAALTEASARDAVDRVAAATGLPRRLLYARALVLKAEADG
jgi:16S rRNA (cytidine1402-2'-O)-methyltransferase